MFLSIFLSIYPYLSICLSILSNYLYLSIYLSIYLYLYIYSAIDIHLAATPPLIPETPEIDALKPEPLPHRHRATRPWGLVAPRALGSMAVGQGLWTCGPVARSHIYGSPALTPSPEKRNTSIESLHPAPGPVSLYTQPEPLKS